MATCDCCGKYYTFGGLKTGRYAFCNGTCQSRGSVLVALDEVPPRSVADYIEAAHRSDCRPAAALGRSICVVRTGPGQRSS